MYRSRMRSLSNAPKIIDDMFLKFCHLKLGCSVYTSRRQRKPMKTLFYLMLVFCSAVLVSAQERVMDKAEFDAMVNGGYDHKTKWKGEKYRMTVITSTTVPGRPQTDFSSKTITEFGSSMETRSTYANVYGGRPAPARESVRIGNWLYTRSGTDAWIRKEYVSSNSTPKETEP